MNIEVGTKCKQVKVIEESGFDFIGTEFELTKVTDTIIMGKGYKDGFGVCFGINADEFENYFELINENVDEYGSVEFTREELELIYSCLCDTKERYDNLIDKIEELIF